MQRVAILLIAIAAAAAAIADGPLTEQDIVQRVLRGEDPKEIIALIERSEVEFDLSDEMVDELKLAGVNDSIIRAMRRRTERAETPPAAVEPEIPAAPTPTLTLRLNPNWEGKEPPHIKLINALDERWAEMLRITENDPMIEDVALTLFCRTADHVPDQWRSKSPLGRDFITAPRHRMLVFHEGAVIEPVSSFKQKLAKLGRAPGAWESTPKMATLTLPIPEQLTAMIDADVEHDLTLGVAVRIGTRYFLALQDSRDAVVLSPDGTIVEAHAHSSGKTSRKLRIEFEKP